MPAAFHVYRPEHKYDTDGWLAVGNFPGDLLIQWLAHTMQALELVLTWVVVLTRQLINCRQRMGVVRRELRVD